MSKLGPDLPNLPWITAKVALTSCLSRQPAKEAGNAVGTHCVIDIREKTRLGRGGGGGGEGVFPAVSLEKQTRKQPCNACNRGEDMQVGRRKK